MKSITLHYFPACAEQHGVQSAVCLGLIINRFRNQTPLDQQTHLPSWAKLFEGAFVLGCTEVKSKTLGFIRHAKAVVAWYSNYAEYLAAEDKFQGKPFAVVYSRFSRGYLCQPNPQVLWAMLGNADQDNAQRHQNNQT